MKKFFTIAFILLFVAGGAYVYHTGGVLYSYSSSVDGAATGTPSEAESDTGMQTVFASNAGPDLVGNVQNNVPITAPPRTPQAGQKEFRSGNYRFSLLYPEALALQSYDEGSGATTFTFQNADGSQIFQIFVVPYVQQQIEKWRFQLDTPSGVIMQPQDVLVGNTRATMFFSNDAVLGDTREVWFLKNGYLYEVTAPKALDVWLSQIMATWQFI